MKIGATEEKNIRVILEHELGRTELQHRSEQNFKRLIKREQKTN